jgi:hypothetical protein
LHCRGIANALDASNGRMIDRMNNDGSRSEEDGDTVVVVVVGAASSSIAMKPRAPTARHAAAVVWVVALMLSVVLVEAAEMSRVALRGSTVQGSPEEGDEQGRGGGHRTIQESLFDLPATSSSSSSSFDLVQGRAVSYAFTDRYQCHAGLDQPIPRMPLPDPIRNAPGLVDFFPQWRGRRNAGSSTTQPRHPLKVVIVGDSIAVQLSQVVDEAIGTHERINLRNHYVGGRQKQECTHVSQSGGGDDGNVVVAGMRLRNLLRNSTRERSDTPQSSEFWNPAVINELLQYEVNTPREHSLQQTTIQVPIGTFDAMVQRIPHGWISLQDITYDSLRENAMLAAKLFGIETLVLINLPLINNVVDYEGKEGYLTLLQKRQLIRNFAATWKPPTGIRLQHVLVLELGDLVDDLLEWNAQLMGFNTSLPYHEWMLGHTLRVNGETAPTKQRQRRRRASAAATAAAARSTPSYYNHKVAHKCAVRVPDTATACPRNSITYDGMHLCMSTLGGRTVSGMACLIDCSLDALETEKGRDDSLPDSSAQLRSCESRCNGQFMSTKPVPAAMMSQIS